MRPAVTTVEVVGDGDGGLDVSWRLVGGGAVELAIGRTPESIDHEHPVTSVEDGSRITLTDLGPGRHYVSVAPVGGGSAVVGAERMLRLDGAGNFRDLGGYRTVDGRWTRWGRVFRSDALHRLSTADQVVVGRLRLRVVYDLRTEEERTRAPSALPAELRRELLTVGGDAAHVTALGDLFSPGGPDGSPDDFLVRAYQGMVANDAPTFGRLLRGLATTHGVPALFHCTAGKDRTGMGAALLLSALGVDERTVLDDYALSQAWLTERRMARLRPRFTELGMTEDRIHSVLGAPRHAMATALHALRERHGSIESYLVNQGGVTPDLLETLRSHLLTARTA
jgi:protein-tyrosine phosphatase